jgi:hypothetical protein
MGMLFGLAQRLKDLWRSSQKGNRLQYGDRYDSDDAFLHFANVSEKRGNLVWSGMTTSSAALFQLAGSPR